MGFENKILQIDSVKQKLALAKNSSHAVLIVSHDKILRQSFAKLLIMQDVCQNGEICFLCPNCKKVLDGNAIDVEYFGGEKQILVGDSARIVADSFVVPLEFEKKYFVLRDFENSTEQAQNKLLKVIEEPQRFDKFLFLTGNPNSLLPTIKSRTEMIFLPQLLPQDLQNVFEDFDDKQKLAKAVQKSNGSIEKCQQILSDPDFVPLADLVTKLVTNMQSTAMMLEYSSEIMSYKEKLSQFFDLLQWAYVDMLAIKSNQKPKLSDEEHQLEIASQKYSQLAIVKIIEQINLARKKLKVNLSQSEIVDNLLLKILEIKFICK